MQGKPDDVGPGPDRVVAMVECNGQIHEVLAVALVIVPTGADFAGSALCYFSDRLIKLLPPGKWRIPKR